MSVRPNPQASLRWRKSSASDGSGECVEAAFSGAVVLIRDSHATTGPFLRVAPDEWRRLLDRIRDGDFGLH